MSIKVKKWLISDYGRSSKQMLDPRNAIVSYRISSDYYRFDNMLENYIEHGDWFKKDLNTRYVNLSGESFGMTPIAEPLEGDTTAEYVSALRSVNSSVSALSANTTIEYLNENHLSIAGFEFIDENSYTVEEIKKPLKATLHAILDGGMGHHPFRIHLANDSHNTFHKVSEKIVDTWVQDINDFKYGQEGYCVCVSRNDVNGPYYADKLLDITDWTIEGLKEDHDEDDLINRAFCYYDSLSGNLSELTFRDPPVNPDGVSIPFDPPIFPTTNPSSSGQVTGNLITPDGWSFEGEDAQYSVVLQGRAPDGWTNLDDARQLITVPGDSVLFVRMRVDENSDYFLFEFGPFGTATPSDPVPQDETENTEE